MTEHQRNVKFGRFRAEPIQRIGDNSEERILEAKHGGKIILPASVWRAIAHRTYQFPMVFRVINGQSKRHVFCGIANFNGEEKTVSIPLWMFDQLQAKDGQQLSVEFVVYSIPKGHFVKLEPLTESFLNITNPKAVLEHCLRNYICLTEEEVISIWHNRSVYRLRICKTLPTKTIIVNEVDLTVDFQEMKKLPERLPEECDLDKIQAEMAQLPKSRFQAFSSTGQSVSGKKSTEKNIKEEKINGKPTENVKQEDKNTTNKGNKQRGIPDYDYKPGTIYFKRHKKDLNEKEDTKTRDDQGQTESSLGRQTTGQLRSVEAYEVPHRPVTRTQTRMKEQPNVLDSGTDHNPNIPSDVKKRKNS